MQRNAQQNRSGGGADDDYFGTAPDPARSTTGQADLASRNPAPHTPTTERPPAHLAIRDVRFRPLDRQQSAIRLRRLRAPPPSALRPIQSAEREQGVDQPNYRHRSSSEPHRPSFPRGAAVTDARPTITPLPSVSELHPRRSQVPVQAPAPATVLITPAQGLPAGRPDRDLSRRSQTVQGRILNRAPDEDCYDSRIVDFLDVVDPEVATLSSITNIQNSLFVPSLGKWVNRRPTFHLSELPPMPGAFPPSKEEVIATERADGGPEQRPPSTRSPSLSSVLSQPQYAILPEHASLEGWPEDDIKMLNDYVRHMLHSRRSKVKQRLKAFVKYASRPLGFLITLYATLITLFGLAWVLFLIGWIYVGDRQLYVINVIDYVLVALFAIVGDGLAPFRAVDTYHMIFVAHYHRKTWKLRKKLLLPELRDHNDLPRTNQEGGSTSDLEAQNGQPDDEFFPVLSDKEQARLVHHQTKLAKSHTFYKPHETETHRAFPLRLLITVILLLDLHSCLQIALGACTWGIPYEVRPHAVTTTILCCSIATNVAAGVLISIGDRRTRKRDVLDRLLKQELTEEVMRKMNKRKTKEMQKEEAKRSQKGDGEGQEAMTSLAASLNIPTRGDKGRKSGEKENNRDENDLAPNNGDKKEEVKAGGPLQFPGQFVSEE
ncbi:hypothetical protein MFIFM68171_03939 [Madurella fahalii]|uniref:Integral membrane protein n=1 Tax=Madurella fahalii TaxID=1157608 RepID=A0ABQ0G7J3_9PEZI